METEEYCAFGHIDVLPPIPHAVALCELLVKGYVVGGEATSGAIDLIAIKQTRFLSHFEFIRRFRSKEAYLEHLVSPQYRALRAGVASALGSPYEDRLFQLSGDQPWPRPKDGDFAAITQLEVLPRHLDESRPLLDGLVEAQSGASGLLGQVLLKRAVRGWNFELFSIWSSQEEFESHLASETSSAAREPLAPLVVAPIEDRPHGVLGSAWSLS